MDELIKKMKIIALNSNIICQHSAALISNDKMFNIGYNKNITYTNKTYSIHAEIDVLSSFYNKKKIKGMDLIVIRVKNKKLCMSKPCKHCLIKITKMGIRKVYYSTSNGVLISEETVNMVSDHISSGNRFK